MEDLALTAIERMGPMTVMMNRRFFLQTASGVIAVPITGFGSLPAYAAREELVVRFEYDISNMDPANRTGSVEDNIILAVCQTLARFNPGKLDWAPDAAKTITQVSAPAPARHRHRGSAKRRPPPPAGIRPAGELSWQSAIPGG